jgi:protein TonB
MGLHFLAYLLLASFSEITPDIKQNYSKIEGSFSHENPRQSNQSSQQYTKSNNNPVMNTNHLNSNSVNNPTLAKESYYQKISSQIESKKTYPKESRARMESGTVIIAFTILQSGDIQNLKVINSSQFSNLDRAALEIIRNIRRFDPLPETLGTSIEIEVPIKYLLK